MLEGLGYDQEPSECVVLQGVEAGGMFHDLTHDYYFLKGFGCLCFPYLKHSFAHKFLP